MHARPVFARAVFAWARIHVGANAQVVAFDDFKRLSTGTSLAEVKVNDASGVARFWFSLGH